MPGTVQSTKDTAVNKKFLPCVTYILVEEDRQNQTNIQYMRGGGKYYGEKDLPIKVTQRTKMYHTVRH